jgi:toxin ParE1/3/4
VKPIRSRPLADADIDEIVGTITRDNPNAARRLLEAIEGAYGLIAGQPGLGSLRYGHIAPLAGVRMFAVPGFSNYLIFYLERDDHVEIVRVLNGARDLPFLLAGEREVRGRAVSA